MDRIPEQQQLGGKGFFGGLRGYGVDALLLDVHFADEAKAHVSLPQPSVEAR